MNINRKVQEYLNKYKSRKRQSSFMAFLSFMVAFTVVMSLVTPAISMTIENSPLAAVGLLGVLGENNEKKEGEPSAQADVSGVQNIADADSHNVNLLINKDIVQPDTEFDRDSVSLEFNLDYTFNASSDKSRFNLDNDKYNLYFEISGIDNPTFILDEDSILNNIFDTEYSDTDKAGDFEIIGNFICIKFTDGYKQHLLDSDGSLRGSVRFDGEVSRSESEDGDKKITVAGEEIIVKFKDKFPEVSKGQGNVNSDGTVSWTVDIKSNGADLSQYNVSDILSYSGNDNITPIISDVNPSEIYNNGQWSLSGTNDIRITYKTKITDEQLKAGTVNNKFSIKKNDSEKEISGSNNAYLSNPFDITKTGVADYSDYENGKIKWQINIKNNYGVNLDGYILNEIINNATIDSMTVTQPSGGQITSTGNDWKLSGVGNANNIVITYETDATAGTYNNTAELKYPDGTPTGDKDPESVEYESESELIKLNKTGSYDANEHKIKWTVTVAAENGYKFKNYKITDDKFTDNVNIKYFKDNHSVNSGNYVTKEGNAYIINDAAGAIDKVVFEYETDVPDEDIVKGTTVANSVGGGPGTSTVATATANINVTARSTAQKNLKGSPLATTVVGSADIPTQTLSWEVLLTLDDKFAGKTYEDKPNATNGAEHTADTDSIKVLASHDGISYEPVDSSKYEINSADGGFTLKFKDDFDSQNKYNFVKITYDTKAAVGSAYASYEFKNSGKFGENGNIGPVSGGTVTRKDANQTMTLNIFKNWSDNVDTKPDSVTFKLKYSTDNGQTWNYVKQNGDRFIYNTDSDYNSANEYTVEIKSNNNNWNSVISGLRQSQEINGIVVQYQYQLEECKFGNLSVDGDTFETDDGIYTVTYGGNGNSVYATNTLKKFINITVKKEWNGKTGSNVKVRLEYRTEQDWIWRPVKINSGEYIIDPDNSDTNLPEVTAELSSGSNWEYKFEKLPDKYNNTYIYYRVAEIECDGKSVDNNRIIFDDGYYNVIYSNNERNNSGMVTVTNKFVKTENTSISVTKEWGSEDIKSKFDSVTVQLRRNNEPYGSAVELTSEKNWKYTWNELPNQEIADGKLTIYTYEVAEIAFKEKGKESIRINGDKYMDSEGQVYTWTRSGNETDGYKITNSAILENTEITLSKEWAGDAGWNGTDENGVEFRNNNRPEKLEFVLESKLFSGEWEEVKGTADESGNITINDSGNPVTVTLTSENASSDTFWNGITLKNLPKYEYTKNDDGTISWNEITYRFRESAYTDKDGNRKDIPADAQSFVTADGNYSISYEGDKVKNTFKKDVGITKTALDGNGKPIPDQTLERTDLVRNESCPYYAEIGDEKYYVFNWQIKYLLKDWQNGNGLPTVEDKLPDGFTLVTDPNVNWYNRYDYKQTVNFKNAESTLQALGEKYYINPSISWLELGKGVLGVPVDTKDAIFEEHMKGVNNENPDLRYYYDTDTNTVYFNKYTATSEAQIYYSIKIPCDDLEEKLKKGNYSIVNQAFTYNDESANPDKRNPVGETEGTLTIKAPSNLLVKDYKKSLVPGYIQYTLDVNPEGKNLSNGNTIDIRDIFDTDSYTDTCHNEFTEGSKLVDVLMTKLTLYKVNENGVKTELKQNEYTMKFASGKSTNDGAALLELSIPDEMHIEIQYTYKIIANENTPSVLNGCKSSVIVNGGLDKMKPGYNLPAGHKIAFHNRAKLISDSATAEDTKRDDEYKISGSGGLVNTNFKPKIKKVNVGNYSINSLDATFLMAKYENGLWYFAKSVDAQSNGAITWAETGMQGNKIDENAGDINVKPAKTVAIEQNILYKLVEVSVPKGYEGSNLVPNDADGEKFRQLIIDYLNNGTTILDGTDYSKFLTNYVSTHYFAYNSNISSVPIPNDVSESDIIQVKSGDDIEIPNSKLIDIGISKEWYGDDNANHDNDSVTVELYWSYEKTASGMPEEATPANADDLGIMDSSFASVKNIKMSELNSDIWSNLPNGKNSKPVYYYVKETAYTVNGITYTLDEESGKFLSGSEDGGYLPIYVGNAVNDDGIVTIKNSQKLYLIKEWKNSKGRTMSAPVSEIAISIYGVDSNGVRSESPVVENVKLTSGNNWRSDITDLIADADLSKYVSFEAVETPGLGDDYVVSCVFNINQLTGEITVTNKDINATDVTVSVRKQWSDGETVHINDSIEVVLYQATEKLGNLNKETIENAVKAGKLKEYDIDDSTVTLKSSDDEVTNWAYSWTGLPMSELDDEGNPVENGKTYYYYVFEKSINLSENGAEDKYTASYLDSSASSNTMYDYTIKNTRNAIVVQKKWVDEDGVTLLPDNEIPNEVKVRVYKNIVPEEEVSVMAVGDSITYGYQTTNDAYPLDLAQALTSAGFKLKGNAVTNLGQNSAQISAFNTNVQGADVICLLGGTNDVHQDSGIKSADKNTVKKAIKDSYAVLIGNLKKNSGKNPIIFLGTIPDFKWLKNSTEATEGGKWWWNYSYSNDATVLKNWETECKNIISYANEAVKEIAGADPDIYLVDINKIITDKYLQDDGCHPNAAGWDKIAEAYGKSIKSYYREYLKTDGTFTADDKDPDIAEFTVNSDGSWTKAIDVPVGDSNGKYIYGVEETDVVANVWKVSYEDNGQQAASDTPVTVINKRNTEKTSIRVHKTWVGDDATADAEKHGLLPNNFYLKRRIENADGKYSEWEILFIDNPTAVAGEKDTWEYADLPARDANGNLYFYTVDEAEIDGYSKTPAEPEGFESKTDGSSAGTVEITNTRQLSISVNKTWSDGNDAHLKDSIRVQLYRSTEIPSDIADKLELKLALPESILVTVDNITEITANKSNISIDKSSLDESIASVEVQDNKIMITGVSAGETSVVITDGKTDETLNITVSSLAASVEGAEFADGYYKITADTDYTLKVTDSGDDVSDAVFSCSNSKIIISGSKLTATALGDYTITVEANGLKVPLNIRVVLPDDFEIIGGDAVNIGETLELGINPNYGSVIWSSSDNTIAEIDADGKVTPKAKGTVVITANREGKIKTKTITVIEKITVNAGEQANISNDGKVVKNVTFTFSGSDWAEVNSIKFISNGNEKYKAKVGFWRKGNASTIDIENASTTMPLNWIKNTFNNDNSYCDFEGTTIEIEIPENENITSIEFKSNGIIVEYVVSYYDEATPVNYMRRSAKSYSASAYSEQTDPFEAYKVNGKTVTFDGGKGDFNKTLTFDDLDVYDENGRPYYYWVAEIDSPNGYTPLYAFRDGDDETVYVINASKPGDGMAEIYNYRETPEGVEMPSTGGTGTKLYHVTGILIISGSLLGIIYYRRRRRKTA